MAEALVFDTTFLIDFQRERRHGRSSGPAHRFLAGRPDAAMALPVTALGEFAEGFADVNHPLLQQTVLAFDVLPIDEQTAYRYAEITRHLRPAGLLIGTNDLWIAACALRHDGPLVTRNADEFRRVPGLRIVQY
jgi:predicted nucleic acid-binding protein